MFSPQDKRQSECKVRLTGLPLQSPPEPRSLSVRVTLKRTLRSSWRDRLRDAGANLRARLPRCLGGGGAGAPLPFVEFTHHTLRVWDPKPQPKPPVPNFAVRDVRYRVSADSAGGINPPVTRRGAFLCTRLRGSGLCYPGYPGYPCRVYFVHSCPSIGAPCGD